MSKELLQDAIQCYGSEIVKEVMELVSISDPDCIYTTFQDMEMDEHAECVEMLFFA